MKPVAKEQAESPANVEGNEKAEAIESNPNVQEPKSQESDDA